MYTVGCFEATESTGSLLSADTPVSQASHLLLFDHISQLLQQRGDAIAV